MQGIMIRGGKKLDGSVKVSGAKNGVLPLLAASMLASSGRTQLNNIPSLSDVKMMINIMNDLGMNVEKSGDQVHITALQQIGKANTELQEAGLIRASLFFLGPLLTRTGYVSIPIPGGCRIGEGGKRPINLHLEGLRKMGATIEEVGDKIIGRVNGRLQGANIKLKLPSFGATVNLLLAAVLAEGETMIRNATTDPEIDDLISFLRKMGARIEQSERGEIRIQGVEKLHGVEHTIIPDHIEAGAYLVAAAVTRGNVFVEGADTNHLTSFLKVLEEMDVDITKQSNGIAVHAPRPLRPVHIETGYAPEEFHTDLQSTMTIAMLMADGVSTLKENVFRDRFTHIEPLRKMGADITIDQSTAIIRGGIPLRGGIVEAHDLRAGIALILAGLIRKRKSTIVTRPYFIARGYSHLIPKFRGIGADIRPINRMISGIREKTESDRPLRWSRVRSNEGYYPEFLMD